LKEHIESLVADALKKLQDKNNLTLVELPPIKIERTRDARHGDFSCNAAMVLAKKIGYNPRELGKQIINQLPTSDQIKNVEIAGPGFINFFLNDNTYQTIIVDILSKGENFGRSNHGQGQSILIEFVSANPTGPLHIGHGRGAAYGAVIANLLVLTGFKVSREYYVNDAGRQMDILAVSILLRYLELCGDSINFPETGYKGSYIISIAKDIYADYGMKFSITLDDLLAKESTDMNPEVQLDELINHVKNNLGVNNYRILLDTGLNQILSGIRTDLEEFGVVFDNWFSERSLNEGKGLKNYLDILQQNNYTYETNGTLWFRSSTFGDEKDRVLIRENGQPTYFASDISYHMSRFERGYAKAIDIWGADHHGYIARVKAAIQALGKSPEALDVLLVQFASLYRGKKKIQMSTRSGEFVTLKELQDEVGKDAARFFYVMRRCEQHLDFDLELAKTQSNDNPVYYIQYAHARICSVLRQMSEKGYTYQQKQAVENLNLLTETHEQNLLVTLARYPDVVQSSALAYEPHQIGYYLRDLANDFHAYYNTHQFLVESDLLRNARLALISATKQVLKNGLGILGVSAPEEM
jgi:arginyl-tRNA synthetase